ncbi:MAG TPA: zf-HC2 domain-containing protein [Chloroflexia bacterium]|nr:zf-HC2 domain-containing protein [Chloroflexia bacterium]
MDNGNPNNVNSHLETVHDPCPGLGEVLSTYLDGELDDLTAQSVTTHLQRCVKCNAEFAELRQVKRFLAPGSPLAPALPSGLQERVRARTLGHRSETLLRGKVNGRSGPTSQPGTLPLVRLGRIAKRPWLIASALAVASMLLLLAIGALNSLKLNPFEPSPVEAAVEASVKDHIMCERLGQVPQSLPGDATQVRTALATAVGMSVAAPADLPPAYNFLGGRAFRAASLDAAHLAWIEEAGKGMLSFYQAADPGGAPPAGWRSVLLDGRTFWLNSTEEANAVLWRANGVLYLLAGKLPEAELLRMALSVNTLGTHAYQHSRIES